MMSNDYDNKIEKKIILETSDETRVIKNFSSQLNDEVFIVFIYLNINQDFYTSEHRRTGFPRQPPEIYISYPPF